MFHIHFYRVKPDMDCRHLVSRAPFESSMLILFSGSPSSSTFSTANTLSTSNSNRVQLLLPSTPVFGITFPSKFQPAFRPTRFLCAAPFCLIHPSWNPAALDCLWSRANKGPWATDRQEIDFLSLLPALLLPPSKGVTGQEIGFLFSWNIKLGAGT